MGSLISKDFLSITICLMGLLSLTSCASNFSKPQLAYDKEVLRSPEGDSRGNSNSGHTYNKIKNREYVADRN
jgi:hypothetical protein